MPPPPPHARVRARSRFGVAVLLGFLLPGALLLACSTNHEVSPWPQGGPTGMLGRFASTPDLNAQLQSIDIETKEHGLALDREVRARLPHRSGTVVIRSYRGKDELGHETHAVRVASAQGVILAVGPLELRDERARATRLVQALADAETGRAFSSGSDTNGDGLADVLLANDAGELEIWRLTPNGSTRYEVEIAFPPRRAVDLGLDGIMDLEGWDDGTGTPAGLHLVDRAAFEEGRWSSAAPVAKAWHARMAASLADEQREVESAADAGAGDAGPHQPPPRAPVDRLRTALERAWHRLRAGDARNEVTAELDALKIPPDLRAWFEQNEKRVLRR